MDPTIPALPSGPALGWDPVQCQLPTVIDYPLFAILQQPRSINARESPCECPIRRPRALQVFSYLVGAMTPTIPVVLYSIISASAGEKLEHDSTSPLLRKQDTHSHCALLNE